jgi:tape measure domain-containing protein
MANDINYTLNLKDKFSKKMGGAISQTDKFDKGMSGLTNGASKLGGVLAGAFSVGSVVAFGSAVIESLKNYEYFHASLKTMLKGNEGATSALEEQLVNLAKTTPFQLTEVQDATKQLLAYGFKAGSVVDTMKTLGDVSAGIGAPLGDIAYLYGTLKTSGRVTLMDLKQFAGRGIPIYDVLAKKLGVTSAKIGEMATAGKIGFKDIENAFKSMTSEGGQFFNLMIDQSKTVGGKISNMADSWEQIKVKIGRSHSGIIAGTIDFLGNFVSEIDKALGFAEQMESSFSKFGGKGESTMTKGLMATIGVVDDLTKAQFQLNTIVESRLSNEKKIHLLTVAFAENEGKRRTGQISNEKAIARNALIQGSLKQVKDKIGLGKMKENPTTKDIADGLTSGNKKSKTDSLGSGTEVTGNRPQALTINITKLIETQHINTTNMSETSAKIKEEVSKALLEAVNDVNTVAR